MLNLSWLLLRILVPLARLFLQSLRQNMRHGSTWSDYLSSGQVRHQYVTFSESDPVLSSSPTSPLTTAAKADEDAPPKHLISNTALSIMLPLALAFCVLCTHLAFGSYMGIGMITFAIFMALIAAIMGIRSLGETDLNPASGISKLTQLVFAMITPKENPNAIIINLLAGSLSDSGAGQAADMMQDFKTAYLLNASPKANFYGQDLGSIFGVMITPFVYRLYTSVYDMPSDMFLLPGAHMWLLAARLVTGQGLPTMVRPFGACAGLIFIVLSFLRIYLGNHSSPKLRAWRPFVPGGIAVAIGMYTTPSFSLPRAIGGLLSWWFTRHKKVDRTMLVVIASGLILGEGVMSLVNVFLASLSVPHF